MTRYNQYCCGWSTGTLCDNTPVIALRYVVCRYSLAASAILCLTRRVRMDELLRAWNFEEYISKFTGIALIVISPILNV